jgi:endonuclease/exonuclease/phosphatase family metal-dependent hydrolase
MPRLKVLTLNLHGVRDGWPVRRDRLLGILQDEEVDVALLQEVSEKPWQSNHAAELAQLTGYALAFEPAHLYFPWPTVANGLAVLSRFPITNPTAVEIHPSSGYLTRGDGERRVAQRVELSLDGMSVVVYNTILPPGAEAGREAAFRLWAQISQDEAVLVVLGSALGCEPRDEPAAFLQGTVAMGGVRGRLVDTWAVAGIGPGETYPTEHPTARLDYVFYQAEPSVIVQEARVVGRHPYHVAPHAAAMATFSISPSRDTRDPLEEEPVGAASPTVGVVA